MSFKPRTGSALEKLRVIIRALPETREALSHGTPTWWGGKRTFAMYHGGGYDDGCIGVWIKAAEGVQADLIESAPERFYRPKYLGPSGWVAMRLGAETDWGEVQALLIAGYRLVAPKRALRELDGPG